MITRSCSDKEVNKSHLSSFYFTSCRAKTKLKRLETIKKPDLRCFRGLRSEKKNCKFLRAEAGVLQKCFGILFIFKRMYSEAFVLKYVELLEKSLTNWSSASP